MKIQLIVEGHGEVAAVPVLLRRFVEFVQIGEIEIGGPVRRPHWWVR